MPTPLVLYGESWADGDRVGIPESDFPAGLPAWMHEQDGWAKRAGRDDLAKRRNITITVPKGVRGMTDVRRHWYPLTGAEPAPRGAAAQAAKKPGPIDPLTGPKLALAGRVVTMDEAFTVKTDAVVYIDRGSIVAVQDRARRRPPASTTLLRWIPAARSSQA